LVFFFTCLEGVNGAERRSEGLRLLLRMERIEESMDRLRELKGGTRMSIRE